MSQIELMPLPVAAVQLEPALLPSVPSSAVPVTRATSPWSVNDSRAGRLRQRVRHQNPAVTWEGRIVGTPDTHPWDCCAEMVLVAINERVERMAISLLRLGE